MSKRRRIDKDVSDAETSRLITVKRHGQDLMVDEDEATMGMLSEAAQEHGSVRNGKVVKVLCYMALIREPALRKRPIGPTPTVTCVKADPQHFSAKRKFDQQAAHWLPGSIKIDNEFCWTYLTDTATARELELLFGDVNPLGSNVNKADSAAEGKGLTEAFALACRHVLMAHGEAKADVRAAYRSVWMAKARQAYSAAIDQKRTHQTAPPLMYDEWGNITNLEARGEAFNDDSIWNVREQISVLDYYMATLDVEPWELTDGKMSEILKT